VRALTVLASPWSALHRNRERIQAATFGTFDGAASSYGVTFAMFAQHRLPAAFVAPIVGLAIASAAGMGGGEAAPRHSSTQCSASSGMPAASPVAMAFTGRRFRASAVSRLSRQ
jgi:hypothetical protein